MALQFFDGFEGALRSTPWITQTNAIVQAGVGRFGSWGLRNHDSNTMSARCSVAASTLKTIGVAYRADSSMFGLAGNGIVLLISGGTTHLVVTAAATTGIIQLRLGSTTGTILQTSPGSVAISHLQYAYVEVRATIADSGGTCIVKVNGVEAINYTGDTKNAGTTTTIDEIGFAATSVISGGYVYWDDFYVLDGTDATAATGRPDNTFLGDVRVEALRPNGNGALSQWVGSDGNSTDNYLLVDEVPANATDYTGTATAGNRDLWTLEDVTAGAQAVFGVQPIYVVQKSDSGAASVKFIARDSGGTVSQLGSTLVLGTTFAHTSPGTFPTKPAGGAWSVADVNGMQLGIELA